MGSKEDEYDYLFKGRRSIHFGLSDQFFRQQFVSPTHFKKVTPNDSPTLPYHREISGDKKVDSYLL